MLKLIKSKRKSMVFILSALIFNMLFVLSACGGGGGGGGGGVIPDPDPPGPVPGPPAAIGNLSASYGAGFGDIKLNFSAPAPAVNTSVQSYDIRYSNTAITAAQFASCNQIAQSITPKGQGSAESFSFNIAALSSAAIFRGANIYFAVRSASNTGYLSEISNIASIKAPWQAQVKIYSKNDAAKFSVLSFGIQGNASSGTDSFDALMPPEHELSEFYSHFTTASDKLIINMHPDFTIDDKWTFIVTGAPLSIVKIEFPAFTSNGPYLNNVVLIEKTAGSNQREFGVPDGVTAAEFTLDGTGRGTYDIYIN
jgi:hypothetical protein